jgi:hypothetical protein
LRRPLIPRQIALKNRIMKLPLLMLEILTPRHLCT